ncbi:hypothetical protein DUI87_23887 [Hirundo rustica rustica]|uniref:Uncharacterized protein n=1 Tax=Hirundo rustica rustica TaxID=333673 RepID=A0A3M0JFN3_HIRRU|nr:hypothetical protein DUI87_23887 [Hirundo rustica rustica]
MRDLGNLERSQLEKVILIFKKDRKENLGNQRPADLSSVSSKITAKVFVGGVEKPSHQSQPSRLHEGEVLLVESNFLPQRGNHLVDLGKAADVISLDFSKALDTVSHGILLDKTSCTQLDNHALYGMGEQLAHESGTKTSLRSSASHKGEVEGQAAMSSLCPVTGLKEMA